MTVAVRLVVALFPAALVPLLVYLIGEGYISLGGGEKDVVWVLPWLLWSIVFAISSFVFWQRGWPMPRSTVWSAITALIGVLVVAAMLAVMGDLGIGGS